MIKSTIETADYCAFCNPAINAKSFCSTGKFSAIYNIAPILPGHSLIIPKAHCESLFQLTEKEIGEMMVFARKVTTILKSFFNCQGFDWTIQDGSAAGQTIPHLHLHIIPRRPADLPSGTDWYSNIQQNELVLLDSENRARLNEKEYNEISMKLTKAAKTILRKEQH